MVSINIAIAGSKGGQGKTTFTATLGAALAEAGNKVLMVETDRQSSLTLQAGCRPSDWNGFYNLIGQDHEFDDVMLRVPPSFAQGELYIIPSSDNQLLIETVPDEPDGSNWVANAIFDRFQEVREAFDYILFDTSPAINVVNSTLFYVSDWVLLPTLCSRPDVDMLQFKTLPYIQQAQQRGQQAGLAAAQVLGIIPNKYDTSTNVDRTQVGYLEGRYEGNYRVFPLVRNSSGWKTSAQLRMSIYTMARGERNAQGKLPTDNDMRQGRLARKEFSPVVDAALQLKEGNYAFAV